MSDYNNYMPGPLLDTKITRPAPRSRLIRRPRLYARLEAGLGAGAAREAGAFAGSGDMAARLILVCAPAGYGKTTLVSAWLAKSEAVQSAWLSLDEADNDPVRFLAYLIAALQVCVPGAGAAAGRLLQFPQPAAAEAALTLLINDISSSGQPIVIVLEDYHVISAPSVHRALAFLVDNLPPLVHLLLITRSDPPLPLSRLRARGQLLEIRGSDLRFSAEEAGSFFSEVMGLSLARQDVVALEVHTEGWIAGLQLAALSLQGRDDLHDFIAGFTSSNRFILDYLTDEVLAKRPQGTREFLLQTSILDRLCGALCDMVTGQSDGQDTLERLEQANLFVIPLDQERRWYRYHHLFAEVLRQRLQREQSSILPELHRRAREWFAQSGFAREAIDHALAGMDYDEAIRLIESLAESMLHTGASASLVKWLDALPQEMVRAQPRLALARAWTYQWGANLDLTRAEEWAQLALQAAGAAGAKEAQFAGEVAALQAMIAATRGDMDRSRECSRLALENLPEESPWRSTIVFSLATTHFEAGDMVAATTHFEEALRLSRRYDVHYIQLAAASFLADLQIYQGHLHQSQEMYEQVLDRAVPEFPQKGGIMARAGLASILCERNQLDEALANVEIGVAKLDQVGGAWAAFVLYRVQARVLQAQGNPQEAAAVLRRMVELGQSTQVSLVKKLAAALHANVQLAQGNLDAASAWAAASGLDAADAEANGPGWRELEYLALARVIAARGERAAALSLLERLLRAAEGEGRFGSIIAIQILLALIYQESGDSALALASLERALDLAEPEGYCRIFLDEGEALARLLREEGQEGTHAGYVGALLAAFDAEQVRHQNPGFLPQPLSEREMDVLRLAAAGASNKAIASQLFIALPTVKKHMGN
ncbi:MAG: tetratricopeptide repeat protein, partial [Candidatus Promineifilaceae bacterium]